jgi:hypothetical protein
VFSAAARAKESVIGRGLVHNSCYADGCVTRKKLDQWTCNKGTLRSDQTSALRPMLEVDSLGYVDMCSSHWTVYIEVLPLNFNC